TYLSALCHDRSGLHFLSLRRYGACWGAADPSARVRSVWVCRLAFSRLCCGIIFRDFWDVRGSYWHRLLLAAGVAFFEGQEAFFAMKTPFLCRCSWLLRGGQNDYSCSGLSPRNAA